MELYDNNFNNNLDLVNEKFSLIIGYTNDCHKCSDIISKLNNLQEQIKYGKINLKSNKQFLINISKQINANKINVPLILLYKNEKYIKKIPNKFSINLIINEINNL